MSEHVHEWHFYPNYKPDPRGYGTYAFVCMDVDCEEAILLPEAERRINAVDKLSANAADYAAEFTQAGTNKHSMDQESEGNIYYLTDALRAYAAALET